MTTPFASFTNATLTFQRKVGVETVDALGNVRADTVDFVVTAYLKEVKTTSKNQMDWEGGLDNAIAVEGRCVSPANLPADITPGTKAIAIIGGIAGEFYYEGSIPSALGTDAILGGKIKGRFITRTVFGEAV